VRRALALGALVMAGEAVFVLPFVIPRVFRPTLLEAFGIDNTQLGAAFSAYGIVAMVSYGLGGPLADRFPVRWMMVAALLCTAAGGVVFATLPGPATLWALYAGWGVTTILLFWAGLLRATRAWGGDAQQGRAYGFLDGGRGLLAAGLSTVALGVFAVALGDDPSPEDRRQALQAVIGAGIVLTVVSAALVAAFVPDDADPSPPRPAWEDVRSVLGRPLVWLQAVIVVCAYVGYKGTDDTSLLASEVLGWSEVQSAGLGTLSFWLRPVSAVAAGLLADRIGGWRTVAGAFVVLLLADLAVASGTMGPLVPLVLSGVVGTGAAVYALRGVYFALTQEAGIPLAQTGAAVGTVSVLGYTPDVFMGPLMGMLLDGAPGATGHQHLFLVLAGFAAVGLVASLAFGRLSR